MDFVLITGATGGLGQAFARKLTKDGVGVLLVGRCQQKLEVLARSLSSEHVCTCCTELRDWEPSSAIEATSGKLGGSLCGIVHCAGLSMRADVSDIECRTAVETMFQVNVVDPIMLTANCAPALASSNGFVMFVSSMAELAGMQKYSVYGSCKRALKGFADSLDAEFGAAGLRVVTVYPGEMKTALQESELGGDGKPYGPEGALHGEALIDPDMVAVRALDALVKGDRAAYAPASGRVFSVMCRLLPRLVQSAMRCILTP